MFQKPLWIVVVAFFGCILPGFFMIYFLRYMKPDRSIFSFDIDSLDVNQPDSQNHAAHQHDSGHDSGSHGWGDFGDSGDGHH